MARTDESKKSQTKAIADLVDITLRYRWRLVMPVFLVTVLVLIGSLFLPRRYKAEAIFESHTRFVLEQMIAEGAPRSVEMSQRTLAEELAGETAIDQLLARAQPELARIMRKRFGFYDRNAFQGQLRHKVIVTPIVATKSMERTSVSYVADDPAVGRLVVNTLVANHIDRTLKHMEERLGQSASFFEGEVARARAQIEDLETQRLSYEIRHAELLPENAASHESSIINLEAERSMLMQRRDSARRRVRELRARLHTTPEKQSLDVTAPNPEIARRRDRKRELERQLGMFLGQFGMTERHPDLLNLRLRIDGLEAEIQSLDKVVVTEKHVSDNPKHRELDLMLATAVADGEAFENQVHLLQQRITHMRSTSGRLFPVRSEYRRIKRDIDQLQRQLAFWEDNLRRIRLTQTAEAGERGMQLEFVKPCEALHRPVSPDLGQVLLAAITLGLLTGGVSVLSAYRSDESFVNGDQLAESMGLPLIGSVSEIISRKQRRMRRLRAMLLYPAGGAVMAGILLVLVSFLYVSLQGTPPDAAATPPDGTTPQATPADRPGGLPDARIPEDTDV